MSAKAVNMTNSEDVEREIRRAAKRGATAVTARRQVTADAVEMTIARWQDALLQRKEVADWEAWAYRVGANAAKKLATHRGAAVESAVPLEHLAATDRPSATSPLSGTQRLRLRAQILDRKHHLVGRQLQVLLKLCEPGMSLHRAAKELGMPRFNVRRAFRSGLRRISAAPE